MTSIISLLPARGKQENGSNTDLGVDADLFALQETKLQEGQIRLELPGYHQYWNYADRKGYSGTAVFAKEKNL